MKNYGIPKLTKHKPDKNKAHLTELSPRQELFCQLYTATSNAYQSALTAGYTRGTANVAGRALMKIPKVATRLYKLRMDLLASVDVDAKFVLEGLKANACQEDDIKARNTALDLLGKYVGLFEKDNTQKAQKITFEMNLDKDV